MSTTEYSFPKETEGLEVIVPEFIELIDQRAQLAILNNDLGIFSQLEMILDDSINQLELYKAKINQARQIFRAEAYRNYKAQQEEQIVEKEELKLTLSADNKVMAC